MITVLVFFSLIFCLVHCSATLTFWCTLNILIFLQHVCDVDAVDVIFIVVQIINMNE